MTDGAEHDATRSDAERQQQAADARVIRDMRRAEDDGGEPDRDNRTETLDELSLKEPAKEHLLEERRADATDEREGQPPEPSERRDRVQGGVRIACGL